MFLKSVKYKNKEKSKNYPFNLMFLKNINNIMFDKNVNYIVGDNGSGKSTLIETIAELYGLHSEGGSRNNIYTKIEPSNILTDCIQLIKYPNHPKDMYFYRSESFYNLSNNLDEIGVSEEMFDKKLLKHSRGESFRKLFKNRFFGNGLYILDEPEAGLSLEYQLELLVLISDLSKNGSQFIIATHSPVLIMIPDANIFQFSDSKEIEKLSYCETKMYSMWEMIFSRREHFIKQLLEEG